MTVKIIVPFWLNNIHAPIVGADREKAFEEIVKKLNESSASKNDFFEHWFIDQTQFPTDLLLKRSLLIASKIRLSSQIKRRFRDRFTSIFDECGDKNCKSADIGSVSLEELKAYFFSYGIGFVKILVDIEFDSPSITKDHFTNALSTCTDTIESLIDSDSLPPFSEPELFEQAFNREFSSSTKTKPYPNWLMLPLERDNIFFERADAQSFVELFVSSDDSALGNQIVDEVKLTTLTRERYEDQLDEDDTENFLNPEQRDFSDYMAKRYSEDIEIAAEALMEKFGLDAESAIERAFEDSENIDRSEQYLNDYKEVLLADYLDQKFSPDAASQKVDEIIRSIEEFEEDDQTASSETNRPTDDIVESRIPNFSEITNIKTTTFKSDSDFLAFIPNVDDSKALNFKTCLETNSALFFYHDNDSWNSKNILISLRYLNDDGSYEEDDALVPYFNFKTVVFLIMHNATLGLYSQLFKITKAINLKPKEFLIEFNGFNRSRNLLDIIRFESSSEFINSQVYKTLHDCPENNIKRENEKNSEIYELIEKRLTSEKIKQEKTISNVVSYGLATISILTVGITAADITNFLGFSTVLPNNLKVLVITAPIIIFLLYMRLWILKTKKEDEK